ncbi:MAG: hypothetical protein NXI30_11535 [bacterium]|nr:hypothetical protein [bacterium]
MSDRAPRPTPALRLTRRRFSRALAWSALGSAALAAAPDEIRAAEPAPAGPPPTKLLDESPFVYVSPLGRDDSESTCHAELWYAWLDDAVVVIVGSDRWKATALARGLDRARIWVGDHGLWKTWYGGRNQAFRAAPNFVAKGERLKDDALLDRLLARYETKYPAEIADWRDPMRSGHADGSRVLIRYTPTA